jgi:hypothetical protein
MKRLHGLAAAFQLPIAFHRLEHIREIKQAHSPVGSCWMDLGGLQQTLMLGRAGKSILVDGDQ